MQISDLGTSDAGFSCSWNHTSDKLAVSTQDGFVSVWDMRYIHTNALSSNPNLAGSTARGSASLNPTTMSLPRRGSAANATAAGHMQRDPTKLACIPSTQHPAVKGRREVSFDTCVIFDTLSFQCKAPAGRSSSARAQASICSSSRSVSCGVSRLMGILANEHLNTPPP